MKKIPLFLAIVFVVAISSAFAVPARADDFDPFGSVAVVTDSNNIAAWQITSDNSVSPGYGGLFLTLPSGVTLGDLTTLSMVVGGGPDEAGSIRFQVDASDNIGVAFAYAGGATNTDPNGGAIASTVNFITAAGLNWNNNGAGVFSGPDAINFPFVTYSTLESIDGATTSINEIDVVADSGYTGTPEVFDVESIDVNGTIYTPTAPVPELNPSSGISAILFVACAGLILRGRRRILLTP